MPPLPQAVLTDWKVLLATRNAQNVKDRSRRTKQGTLYGAAQRENLKHKNQWSAFSRVSEFFVFTKQTRTAKAGEEHKAEAGGG